MRYKRVLLKLSGQAVSGPQEFGFDVKALEHIADEVLGLHDLGVEISIVIGGGNIFRGNLATQWGIERAEADNIGMMGTLINSLMLRGVLTSKSRGTEVRVMSAIPVNTVAEVTIPAHNAKLVTESGIPATMAEGVTFLRMENGNAVFETGSGRYHFMSQLQ